MYQILNTLVLGSTSEKDIDNRIGMAWTAANKMDTIIKSNMNKNLKIRFFQNTVESVLLYGSECWTITKSMEKRLNGNYTRLLRKVQNVSWDERLTIRTSSSDNSCYGNETPWIYRARLAKARLTSTTSMGTWRWDKGQESTRKQHMSTKHALIQI